MDIIRNDYFLIFEKDNYLFIQTYALGFLIENFNNLLKQHPRIAISNFGVLKNALETIKNTPVKFGYLKPKFEISISRDNLEAILTINLSKEDIELCQEELKSEIMNQIKAQKITHGILYDNINKNLIEQSKIVIAKGKLPTPGEDAKTKFLELPEYKPTLRKDGTIDYYEMNLFNTIKKGDWLGEKILPTKGEDGINIKGEVLSATSGKDKIVRFDANTVDFIEANNKIEYLAKCDGVFQFDNAKLHVANHLIIESDVNFETGNVNFNGYVTIKGTIADGFSVEAEKDISVESSYGLGAVKHIISHNGSIYLKGGISGKGKSILKAGENIYVKYINSCIVKAQKTIDIGYYALDSDLEADSVIIQSKIGGSIRAKSKVSLQTVGNIYEKKTNILVEGFDRKTIKKELDELLLLYKDLLAKSEKNRRALDIYETTLTSTSDIRGTEDYIKLHNEYEDIINQIYILEYERKNILRVLSSRGEGEVSIYEKAYPQTILQIKNLQTRIEAITKGTFYTFQNKLMKDLGR